ncbi:unnamed protein product [Prunus armeniaca]
MAVGGGRGLGCGGTGGRGRIGAGWLSVPGLILFLQLNVKLSDNETALNQIGEASSQQEASRSD